MATQVNICNLALRRLGERNEISAIDESTKNAEYCNAFWDYILYEVLEDYPWDFAKKARSLGYTSGFAEHSDSDIKTITDMTQADPIIVTSASHGWFTAQTVYIYDVLGMTEVNQRVYEIEKVDANRFKLLGIDGSVFTAYDSCGSAVRMEAQSKYSNGYVYDLPADYLRALHLDDETSEFEIMGSLYNRRLITNVKDAILVYISEETTTTNMKNRFINSMAWRLAAELAVPLGKKGAKQDWAMGMYNYILGKSTTSDARAEKQNFVDADPWIKAGGFIVS